MTDKPRILIVDDDPAVTELLEVKLAAMYQVSVTNDPREVQALARSLKPQAVVCDIDMPGMDGGEVCHRLRNDPQTQLIPVLYLTSMVSSTEVAEWEGDVGGRPGVAKDAPIQQLARRIAEVIAAG
jgi:CheY-like chemotaxis protein